MRPVINRAGHDFETEALVICTDYSDDEAWRAVVALLDQSDGEFEVRHHLVDDRAYAGASPDEMALSAVAADPGLEVVFLADAATMTGDHSLLVVSTRPEELENPAASSDCCPHWSTMCMCTWPSDTRTSGSSRTTRCAPRTKSCAGDGKQ